MAISDEQFRQEFIRHNHSTSIRTDITEPAGGHLETIYYDIPVWSIKFLHLKAIYSAAALFGYEPLAGRQLCSDNPPPNVGTFS